MSVAERTRPEASAPRPGAELGCALVTGASRGIGAAIASALAADGRAVAVNYREDADGAEAVAQRIRERGGTALVVRGDVRDPATPDALFAEVEAGLGPVSVLVNNAGLTADALAMRIGDDAWERVIETNLTGAFRLTRRALSGMIRARFGRVVNLASVVGLRANAGQANYAASKAGLIGFTKSAAVEVARRGVTVNAVAPGLIETGMTESTADGLRDVIPARRAGRPEEVAACVRFLASDEAAYITGTVLTVDGGMTA